jgi:hypothetical protein
MGTFSCKRKTNRTLSLFGCGASHLLYRQFVVCNLERERWCRRTGGAADLPVCKTHWEKPTIAGGMPEDNTSVPSVEGKGEGRGAAWSVPPSLTRDIQRRPKTY